MKRYLAISLLLSLAFSFRAAAQVPQYITYQGVLNDKTTGTPVADGSHTVGVSFFASADTSGTPLASFSIPAVQTSKGLFNVIVQITDAKLFSRPLFMGVKFDNSGYVDKASAVTTTPYSFYSTEAAHATRANVADSLAGGIGSVTRQSLGAAASGVNADITALNALTKPLTIAQGGTGASNATTARVNLGAAASGANNDITSLSALTGSFAISQGGTGATTAAAARTNLGAASSGANSDITSLTGLTTPISLAQGGTAATTASGARTNLGLGTIATQNSNGVAITGGTVDATSIGATTPAPAVFTTLQYNGNIFTLGNETDNATALNAVNISGTVPIAIVMPGASTGPITANVGGGSPGQWLYIVNRANFNVTFAATVMAPNTAAQFLNVTGLWTHVQ